MKSRLRGEPISAPEVLNITAPGALVAAGWERGVRVLPQLPLACRWHGAPADPDRAAPSGSPLLAGPRRGPRGGIAGKPGKVPAQEQVTTKRGHAAASWACVSLISRSRFMASATRSRVRSVTLESGDSSSAICCRVTPIRLASAACDKPRSCLAHRSWSRTARIGATVMKVDRPGVRRRWRGRGGAEPVDRGASSPPSSASRARLTAARGLVPNVWQPGQSGKPTRVRCPSVVRRARYCMVRSASSRASLVRSQTGTGLSFDTPHGADRYVLGRVRDRHETRSPFMAEVLVRPFRPHEYPPGGLEQPDDRSRIHTARPGPSRKVARYSLPGKGAPRGISRTREDRPGTGSGETKRPASDPRSIECGPGGSETDTRRSESSVNRINARRVDYARSRGPGQAKTGSALPGGLEALDGDAMKQGRRAPRPSKKHRPPLPPLSANVLLGVMPQPAKQIHQPHLLDGPAARREERRRRHDDREGLCPAHRHVQPVAVEEKIGPPRRVLQAGAGQGDDDDRRLLTLELVHAADARRGSERRLEAPDLHVVRRDQQDVALEGEGVGAAGLVEHRPAEEIAHDRLDAPHLLRRRLGVAVVLDGHEHDAGFPADDPRPVRGHDPLPARLRVTAEPSLVDRVRDEAADVRVHPARFAEEYPEIAGYRGVSVEEVVEAGTPALSGVAALGRLGELHLVPDENDVARGGTDGDEIRERHLSRLIDEEIVEAPPHLLSAEKPGGTPEERAPSAARLGGFLGLRHTDRAAGALRVLRVSDLDQPESPGFRAEGVHHGVHQVDDRLVAVGGHPDALGIAEQGRDDGGRGVGPAGSRRALDAERGAVEAGGKLDGLPHRILSFRDQRAPGVSPDAGRAAVQQVVHPPGGALTFRPRAYESKEGFLDHVGRSDLVRNQIQPVRRQSRLPRLDDHTPRIAVHLDDLALPGEIVRGKDLVPCVQLGVLVGVEPVFETELPLDRDRKSVV